MAEASETHALTPALTIWQAYDPEVKADLSSTSIRLGDRLFLIDPIPLAGPALTELTTDARICSVFLTNINHARAAAFFADKTGATVCASAITASSLFNLEILSVSPGDMVGDGIEVIGIEGAAEGEIALHFMGDGGAVVVGDALINFGQDGFGLLPAKYCSDQKMMQRSLRQLLDFSFERLLFAHGAPIVSGARAKLEALIGSR
ncbi:MAG: hypothetical protein H0X40_17690 [Chthoniobacterales bacterium]|nr:hypothetical protein [Chthoniobacterales bacterium]